VMSVAASARRRGHEVALALGNDDEIIKKARRFRPDVVGFSVLTGFQRRWLSLAGKLKAALDYEPVTLFGGPHPTFYPEIVMDDALDVACRGEGDEAVAELMDAVEAGERKFEGIANLAFKTGEGYRAEPLRPLAEVDKLPFPDREISYEYSFIRHDPNAHFIAGRGCPYSCSFCFNRKFRQLCRGLGPTVRMRSPDNLIEEIAHVNRRWGIKTVYFQDDTFILNKEWLFSFLEQYADKLGLPFFCTVRADLVTPEIAHALKTAGCYRVSFGVESGVESIRREMLKKNITDDEIRETARILHGVGLEFQTTNMMGLPGERLEDAVRTLRLNIEIGADVAWTSLYQPYPGTELGEYALKEGYVDGLPDDERIADAHTASLLKQPDIEKIERLQKFAYMAVKFPGTLPLVLKLIHRDHPGAYYYLHRISYFLFYFRRLTRMNCKRMAREAGLAWKYYR